MGILNYVSSIFLSFSVPQNVTTYGDKSPSLCVNVKSEVQHLRGHCLEEAQEITSVLGYSREYGKTPNGKNAEAEECRQCPRKPRKKLERDF